MSQVTDPFLLEAAAFVEWCNGPSKRQELKRTSENSHNLDPLDEVSKWANYANRLRQLNYVCSVSDEVCKKVETMQWWNWDLQENCKCDTCRKQNPHAEARHLYIEKMVRKTPWPEQILDEEQELLKSWWHGRLGKLQEFCKEHDRNHRTTFGEIKQFVPPEISNTFENGKTIDNIKQTERLYRISSYLNHIRRNISNRDDLPEVLKTLTDPRFDIDHRANFQGTVEDNFCLGSQGPRGDKGVGGVKFYIGITNNPVRRHEEHSNEGRYPGSKYIKKLCYGNVAPDPFGGWKLEGKKDEENKDIAHEIEQGAFSGLREDCRTEMLTVIHGQNHVRGGIYCSDPLTDKYACILTMKERAEFNLCYRCGKENCDKSSPCAIQPRILLQFQNYSPGKRRELLQPGNDDFALRAEQGIKGDDTDTREFDHFDLLEQLGGELTELGPTKCVLWSSGAAEFEVYRLGGDESFNLPDFVDSIFPEIKRKMRWGQWDALQKYIHCNHNNTTTTQQPQQKSVVLAVPTAYGKTKVYQAAALYEVLKNRKKVVIFLPYTALLSDIANSFASISKSRNGNHVCRSKVVNVQADVRVKSVSMPYGGNFFIPFEGALREVKWTIWRGITGDPHMRNHMKSDAFKEADIILTTPDKWGYPDSSSKGCDSYVSQKETFFEHVGLAILDEAHQFRGILGGTQRELLCRMNALLRARGKSPMRIMLASATMGSDTDAKRFAQKLLKQKGGNNIEIVQPESNQEFEEEIVDTEFSLEPMIRIARQNANMCQRLLLLYPKKLTVHNVCKNILFDVVKDHRNIRRVLIFVDSKSDATCFIKWMNRSRGRKSKCKWPDGYEVRATPYHGDCASMHRRVYESMMGKWVGENQLHVIVATSALEAGVNICGADLIIIPDASRCSTDSLTQRIGRGGRDPLHPAIVVVGADPEEMPNLFDNCKKHFSGHTPSLGITTTRAIVLNSCKQYLQNVRYVKNMSPSTVREYLTSQVQQNFPGNASTEDMLEIIEGLYKEEVLVPNKPLSARGIQSNSIKARLCEANGNPLHPWLPQSGEDAERPPVRYVELGEIDSIRSLKYLHPEAHYKTPHGRLVRVLPKALAYVKKRQTPDDNWLENVSAVNCTKLTINDFHGDCETRGEYDDEIGDFRETYKVHSNVRVGLFTRTIRWTGFSYRHPYRPSELCGQPKTKEDMKREMGYDENFVLFNDIKSQLTGWQCSVVVESPEQMRRCLEIAGVELTVRGARALQCSPQQFTVDVKEGEGLFQVRGYEMCPSGLARQFLRLLTEIFPEEEENKLFCKSKKKEYTEIVDQMWNVEVGMLLGDLTEEDESCLFRFLDHLEQAMKEGETPQGDSKKRKADEGGEGENPEKKKAKKASN